MISRIRFILIYWFAWLLSFSIARGLFLFLTREAGENAGFQEVQGSMLHGLLMDISMSTYLSLPVILFLIAGLWTKIFNSPIIYKAYTIFIVVIVLLLFILDVNSFKAWGFRLDANILKYLSSPKEAWASVANLPVYALLGIYLLLVFLLSWCWFRIISSHLPFIKFNKRGFIALGLIAVLAFSIIPLRGGIQLAPINQSSVYFSNNNYANQAALNPVWNFVFSVLRSKEAATNPFDVIDHTLAFSITDSLYRVSEVQLDSVAPEKKNVILVIWESFTAKVVNSVYKGVEVTPGFNRLKNEGIYFSSMYASGDRTDKGIVSILSGYPAQPTTSIVKHPGKAAKLPMVSSSFKEKGYHTSLYYGGELEFANIKSYLLNGKFNSLVDVNDFNKADRNSKWGAHDGVVMQRFQHDLSSFPQPFFSTWLTLSSHEPFETPVPSKIQGNDEVSLFLNSLNYTDGVVETFVEYCRKQSWWKNTILIIIADHGHRLPVSSDPSENFRIPMLILGGNIASGQKPEISSQTDLAATLLSITQLPANTYPWSRDLFSATFQPFAWYTFNNGFGYIQPGKILVYDNIGQRPIYNSGQISKPDIEAGRAMQQVFFQDFLDK